MCFNVHPFCLQSYFVFYSLILIYLRSAIKSAFNSLMMMKMTVQMGKIFGKQKKFGSLLAPYRVLGQGGAALDL